MNQDQIDQMKRISENITECWTRIKAKARSEGHITNIEKYAPCITGALNNMENFLIDIQHLEETDRTAIKCG